MATYPTTLKQSYDSQIIRASGIKTERGGNGSLWIRRMYTATKYDFKVVHASLTKSEHDTLQAFYVTNLGIAFDFVWNGDGATYTNCYFIDVPQVVVQTSLRQYKVSVAIAQQ